VPTGDALLEWGMEMAKKLKFLILGLMGVVVLVLLLNYVSTHALEAISYSHSFF
jgi:Tfp pilus assembly protein PilN